MTQMVDFSVAILQAVADFLSAEPIIYLFALVLVCFIVKVVKTLI